MVWCGTLGGSKVQGSLGGACELVAFLGPSVVQCLGGVLLVFVDHQYPVQ